MPPTPSSPTHDIAAGDGRAPAPLPGDAFGEMPPLPSRVLFWPARFLRGSPMLHHLPLIFWLVEAIRPRLAVGLEVGDGVGYLGLCQAVDKLGLGCRCLGFGDWSGADGAANGAANGAGQGAAGPVPGDIATHHDAFYGDISRIEPAAPESVAGRLRDGAVDLLLLDGPRTAAQTEMLIRDWPRKMSDRGVIVLHGLDTHLATAAGRAFVARLRGHYPSITFPAGAGLEVVLYGPRQSTRLQSLAALAPDDPASSGVQAVFGRLGRAQHTDWRCQAAEAAAAEARARAEAEAAARQAAEARAGRLDTAYAARHDQIARLQARMFDREAALEARIEAAEAAARAEAEAAAAEIARLTEALEAERTATAAAETAAGNASTEAARLTEALEAERAAREALRETARAEAEAAAAEIARLTEALEAARTATAAAEETARDRQAEIDQRFAEITRLTEALEAERAAREALRETARAEAEAAAAEIARLTESLEAAHAAAREAAGRDAAEAARLTEALEAARTATAAAEETARDRQAEIDQRFAEIARLTEALEAARAQTGELRGQIDTLTRQHEAQLSQTVEHWRLLLALKDAQGRLRSGRGDPFRGTGLPGLRAQLEMLRAAPEFDPDWYLKTYEDVRAGGMDPAEHYLRFGTYEGRNPGPGFDTLAHYRAHPDAVERGLCALVHARTAD